MRFRHLTILLLPVLLAGCGLPPAIAVASYAADGLLLVTTGKSSTDHALSFATGEDCAMWRVVQGEAVCTELSAEGGSQIALDTSGASAGAATDAEPAIAAAPPGAITSQELAAPAGPGTAPASAAAADRGAITGTLTESDRTATVAPVSLAPATATPEPTAPDTSAAPRIARIEPLAPVATPRPIAVVEVPRGTAIAAAAPSPAAEAALPAGHYFVLASYRDRSNAERHAARLHAAPARIMAAEIDGVTHYRVLAGPYASTERATAQAALADTGNGESWPLDLCGGACEPASQLASAD